MVFNLCNGYALKIGGCMVWLDFSLSRLCGRAMQLILLGIPITKATMFASGQDHTSISLDAADSSTSGFS